jgi:succinyl-CoA synthetase beta subunit
MNLFEFQGKELFRKFGVPTPEGFVISSESELDGKQIQWPVAIKSQVLVGGRGKAGGIRFADNLPSAKAIAKELFSAQLKGLKVRNLLIESKLNIDKELYLSIAIDTSKKRPLIMASQKGGVDIESVSASDIHMEPVDPFIGFSPYMANSIAKKLALNPDESKQFAALLGGLYKLFKQYDAELVEINPLVITKEGKLIAADAKVSIDQDSLYRHPDIKGSYDDLTELENEARMKGYSFIELDGTIGVVANGAGLTMATLDTLLLHGMKPRNFLDLGGTDNIDTVKNAFPLVLKANPKSIFVNIFGGVTKCDTVAQGIVAAKNEFKISVPLVVRLSGVHEVEGRKILSDNKIHGFPNMTDGVKKVAELSKS